MSDDASGEDAAGDSGERTAGDAASSDAVAVVTGSATPAVAAGTGHD